MVRFWFSARLAWTASVDSLWLAERRNWWSRIASLPTGIPGMRPFCCWPTGNPRALSSGPCSWREWRRCPRIKWEPHPMKVSRPRRLVDPRIYISLSHLDLSVVQLHRHEFEESINGLRGQLLRRRSSIEKLRNLVESLQEKTGIKLEKPLHLLANGIIDRLQLVGRHLRTPSQLKQRLEELRHRFQGNRPRRNPRSFGAGNDDDELMKIKGQRLRVGNLVYQGQLLPGNDKIESFKTLNYIKPLFQRIHLGL